MRIVAVQTGLEADSVLGGEITDREFLLRLADAGAEIHVLTAHRPGHPVVDHPNVVPHYFPRGWYRKIPYSLNLDVARALKKLLRTLDGVDWVRFNSPYAVGIGTILASRGKRIWGSYLHVEDFRMWKLLDRILPRFCTLVTCLSPDTWIDVVERCPAVDGPQTVVVPIGIDLERMDANRHLRSAVRDELGIAKDEVVALFVGVAIPRKGIGDLVAAWKRLSGVPGARLVVISKPVAAAESDMLKSLAAEDPRVVYLSKVPYERIPAYFWASDLFFFPTHREGFGIVVGEAMAAGLPVLTTNARGVRGVVEHGTTAFVTEVGDVPALAESLRQLMVDAGLRDRLGNAGRKRVEALFSWPAILRSLQSLLGRT